MSAQLELDEKARRDLEPSCPKCIHVPVCLIFKTQQNFLASAYPPTKEGKETAPFKAEETAKICSLYVSPRMAMEMGVTPPEERA